jgi:periplasmic protein CpxP/Spy
MKNRILTIASIAALVIGATVFAVAHGLQEKHERERGEGRRGDMVEHISRELNLMDAQKEQVKAIFEAQRLAGEERHAKLDDIRKQIDAATANGQFDETAVRTLANQQAQLMADEIVDHARMHSKIYGLLTAVQRTKADQLMKSGEHRRGPGGPGHHGPPPPPPGL